MNATIKKLVIETQAADDPLTRRLQSEYPHAAVEMVDDPVRFLSRSPAGKDTIVLMRHGGSFVKDFHLPPCSPPCGERYIITMLNCPYSCTYCYLQSYLDHRWIVLFSNTNDISNEVRNALERDPSGRLTTGELGDSLALDHLTGATASLLPLFEGRDAYLEVRTKSAQVNHLIGAVSQGFGDHVVPDHACPMDRLIITWTLGPEQAIHNEEPGTATLDERLAAIGKAAGAGIAVGIRFDPIIPYYADPVEYGCILERIAAAADGRMIRRFELGVLRFPPGLWETVRKRRPSSPLLRGEFVSDREGKIRLYRRERIRLYGEIHDMIRNRFPDTKVELSMEEQTVWEDAGVPPPGGVLDG